MFSFDGGLGSSALTGGRSWIMTTTVRHHHRHMVLLWHAYMSLSIEVVLFLPVTILLMANYTTWKTLRLIYTMPQLLLAYITILLGLELTR